MPKRIIDGEGMWASDKLASCSPEVRGWYSWLYPLADPHGNLELTNLPVILGKVGAIRPELNLEFLERILWEFENAGLLFTWESNGKRYGHWTKSELPGRLPPKSHRSNRYEKIVGAEMPHVAYERYIGPKRSWNTGQGGSLFSELKRLCQMKCLSCGRTEGEKVKRPWTSKEGWNFYYTYITKLCADHVLPLSLGGPDKLENIQVLCTSCNTSKRSQIEDYRSDEIKAWCKEHEPQGKDGAPQGNNGAPQMIREQGMGKGLGMGKGKGMGKGGGVGEPSARAAEPLSLPPAFQGKILKVTKETDDTLEKIAAYNWIADRSVEYAKADAWLIANPARRKKNYAAFIVNWFANTHKFRSKKNAEQRESQNQEALLRGLGPGREK